MCLYSFVHLCILLFIYSCPHYLFTFVYTCTRLSRAILSLCPWTCYQGRPRLQLQPHAAAHAHTHVSYGQYYLASPKDMNHHESYNKDCSRGYKIVPAQNPLSTINMALPSIKLTIAHTLTLGNSRRAVSMTWVFLVGVLINLKHISLNQQPDQLHTF